MNGAWVAESNDLYFIKTENTITGSIEVRRLSGAAMYKTIDIDTGSAFSASEASKGKFDIDNGDLYFIKYMNTESGNVEIHVAGHQKNFAEITYHAVSSISAHLHVTGEFTVRGGDLYLIQLGTSTGKVELVRADGAKDYKNYSVHTTSVVQEDHKGADWFIGAKRDLYVANKRETKSGLVEVYVATAESIYEDIFCYATDLSDEKGLWGVSCM